MLLKYLKNSLDTRGLPTKFKRTYELLPDGRHSVKWTGAKGNKGQSIFIEYEPDGTKIKCFVCSTNCLTAAVKYQRKNGDHKKRHTCTRICQEELTKNHKYNPLIIEKDDEGWYIETCKGGTNGYMMKRIRPVGKKHRIKIFKHRWVMEQYVGKEALINMHVHHIDMNKLNNDISNLWLCTPKQHMSAHHSFNKCCVEAFKRPIQFGFNVETGKYYLKEKK
tara:strand:+ start:511 stop:1173 length:663 start_codon:yes stop_codon:yes gene_type:complete